MKPVIAVVHGACVGGGVDMISACDIRLASKDAFFQIKVCTFEGCDMDCKNKIVP